MTHLVVEDDFGPFLTLKEGFNPQPEDKILMEGSEADCKRFHKELIDAILDDSPVEFWRDYN